MLFLETLCSQWESQKWTKKRKVMMLADAPDGVFAVHVGLRREGRFVREAEPAATVVRVILPRPPVGTRVDALLNHYGVGVGTVK